MKKASTTSRQNVIQNLISQFCLFIVLLGVFLVLFKNQQVEAQYKLSQTIPVPWPFPWARECPVDWKDMEGRYWLEKEAQDSIDLSITIFAHEKQQLIRVARYAPEGQLLSEGYSQVEEGQNAINLWLEPVEKGLAPFWAQIRMHYNDSLSSCEKNHLVPILSLEEYSSLVGPTIQYRLIRFVN